MKTSAALQQTDHRENDRSFLEIYDTERGTRTVVQEFDHLIEAPNWSKDGKFLVYNSRGRLYRFELTSRESRAIDTGFAVSCNNDHVLSPDGGSIAFSCGSGEDGASRIFTAPLTGGIPKLITPLGPSYLHGWSPDGSTLAYCAERNGEFDIYAVPAAGGTETRLTDSPGLNDGPEYDGAGEFLWFNSVRSGLMQLWRMKPDGSCQTQMTFDETRNSWFPHLSPDGKTVAYLAYRKGDLAPHEHLPRKQVELRLMPASGGKPTVIVELFGGQGTVNVNSWSPDSKQFAFVSYALP